MASFEEHIAQAKRNLAFLKQINEQCNDHWDWQVTTCFYVAVHLANAHIAKMSNMHYRSHSDVKFALNPENKLSITKFNEEQYKAYVKLMNLSRRARYLCHENPETIDGEKSFMTYDVHMNKALKNLDILLVYFKSQYNIEFESLPVKCLEVKNGSMVYFSPIS
ncbi:hypothetical protein GCM10009118_04090 [Wandonia haliotis]|uniref:HEPN domain-containing protein n=1 Tax=Wandonia haliotis TaxID=574963 RepID=A0ABP3XXC5_9FLAO